MPPDFSEFNYGFAFVYESFRQFGIANLPIFPTQPQERYGGYDVALDVRAEPIFVQFKRADYFADWQTIADPKTAFEYLVGNWTDRNHPSEAIRQLFDWLAHVGRRYRLDRLGYPRNRIDDYAELRALSNPNDLRPILDRLYGGIDHDERLRRLHDLLYHWGPFHRFPLSTKAANEDGELVYEGSQHDLLVKIEEDGAANGLDRLAVYSAPRFHTTDVLRTAWNDNTVWNRSLVVRASEIGRLDVGAHRVSYTDDHALACSDPKVLKPIDMATVVRIARVRAADRVSDGQSLTLSDQLPQLADQVRAVISETGRHREAVSQIDQSLDEESFVTGDQKNFERLLRYSHFVLGATPLFVTLQD